MTYIKKKQIQGTNDLGTATDLSATAEGHLEVAIHGPKLPFGSVHTENLTPIFQADAVYGINQQIMSSGVTNSGWAYTSDSAFVIQSGTASLAQAYIQSRKRLRYRAGQGVIGRFTALFTSPVAYSYQVIGFGHAEDGVYFGYKDISGSVPEFGILYVNRGVREIKTLTVSTGATSNGNVTITLNGIAFTVAVTNASNIQRTVWEIAQGTYTGWRAYPNGTTVVFVRDSAGTTAGTQSFSAGATGAAATIVQTTAGAASTETFVPKSQWNGDKLDGTGASGVTLDPTKGNVYEIQIQYLGFGSIDFKIETALTGNNSDFVTVHTLRLPNTLTATSFGNPAFPFTMAVYSAGSTTNLTLKCGSLAGYIEGKKILHGPRASYFNSSTSVGSANYTAMFTVLNPMVYGGRTNQSVINIISLVGALKHTSPCIFYLIKNGTLAGNPNFTAYSASNVGLWDTAATTVSFTSNAQLLFSDHLGDTGDLDTRFANGEFNAEEFTLQPGEWITVAAKSVTGTPSYVTASLNTREDI